MPLSTVLLSLALTAAPAKPAAPAAAPGEAKADLALQVIELGRMTKMLDLMRVQVREVMVKQMLANTCEAAKPSVEAIATDFADATFAELQADHFKIDVAAVYAESFDEDELKELIAFYQSPLGQKLLDRMPALMQKTMLLTQDMSQRMGPAMEKVMQDHKADLQNIGAQCPKPAATGK